MVASRLIGKIGECAMYYGFVGGSIKNVFDDWKKVERLALIYPYASYRKFKTESEAWIWLGNKGSKKITDSVIKYGNLFKDHHITIEYIIDNESVCYNVKTAKLGYVKLFSNDPTVIIENRTGIIMVEIKGLCLNKDLILSHLIAIQNILQIVGPFVDVDILLPNHGVFYALTHYTGTMRHITRILEYVKHRTGNVAWTLKEYEGL